MISRVTFILLSLSLLGSSVFVRAAEPKPMRPVPIKSYNQLMRYLNLHPAQNLASSVASNNTTGTATPANGALTPTATTTTTSTTQLGTLIGGTNVQVPGVDESDF